MGINGRMRQETRGMWRHHRLCSHSCGKSTQRSKDQSYSKSEGQCHYQSKSGPDRQWHFSRRGEGQRLSKVRPRALCVQNHFRTDHALSRMGPRWDAVFTDQGVPDNSVNFREKNTNRTGDGGLATGSGGLHARTRTHTLTGQDSGSQNPTLSNDWTAQMQALMSNPELAQEQFGLWQLLQQHFQHLQYKQQLGASSDLESWQIFQHSGEDGESVGGQLSMDTRMDQTGV